MCMRLVSDTDVIMQCIGNHNSHSYITYHSIRYVVYMRVIAMKSLLSSNTTGCKLQILLCVLCKVQ